ncbi:MAG: amino acid ABC transporter permease [SAR324 cluster bacterium]|nr:amino acid ABC transporter permease [SAR324 cluster bacterium]
MLLRDFGHGDILLLIYATRWTIALSLIAFAGGGLFGFAFTILRILPIRLLNYLSSAYIQIIQGTPLLLQLFVVFFGLAILGWDVSAWTAAAVALIAYTSAFLAEIWRGCIQAIPKPQWEASSSLGLGIFQLLWYVIMPQAIKISIPPTVGFLVQVIKGTALTSVIGFVELTRTAQLINNVTLEPFAVYSVIAVIYFSLCFPLTSLSRRLERRLNVSSAN